MTQIELIQKFAEAYGVAAERVEYGKANLSRVNLDVSYEAKVQCEQSLKDFPINEDTLTLFQLCIEHGFTIKHELLGVFPCVIVTLQVKKLHIYEPENYVAHETKQAATCAAMFEALCKLKNIGSE